MPHRAQRRPRCSRPQQGEHPLPQFWPETFPLEEWLHLPFAFFSPILSLSDLWGRSRGMVLTRRQREVLDFIAEFLRERGYSPSFQEIARGMGLNSLATVHKHISTLERRGFWHRGYNQSRSLEPSPKYWQEARRARAERGIAGLPLMGRIAA